MLKQISSEYIVDVSRIVSANIMFKTGTGRCCIYIRIQSDTGEIETDHVFFETLEEAKAALKSLTENYDVKIVD